MLKQTLFDIGSCGPMSNDALINCRMKNDLLTFHTFRVTPYETLNSHCIVRIVSSRTIVKVDRYDSRYDI